MCEYSKSLRVEVKATLSEIKKNPLETNSEGKEARIQINDLEQKEKINIQPEQKKKQEFKKHKESIRWLWDISKRANIQIIGVPEGEEEEQEIKNLFEKIMKENFLSLVKEIDIQVQEAQRVPNKLDLKRATERHIIIKMSKVKNKENLKSSKRKGDSYLQRSSCKTVSWLISKETLQSRWGLARSIQSDEKQGPTSKITLSSKAII